MNFQNIPRKDKIVKTAFGPKLDALAFWDYDAIEYRLLAYYLHFVGHDSMAEDFRQGLDPHTQTTLDVLGHCDTDLERQIGKTLNFAIIFGAGAFKIASMLTAAGIPTSLAEGRELFDTFHAARPGIRLLSNPPPKRGRYRGYEPGLIERTIEQRGYVKTLWGRHLKPHQPHKALNALIQGCAGDLMRAALLSCHTWATKHPDMDSHMVLTTHDEAGWDIRLSELPYLAYHVPRLMTDPRLEEVLPITAGIEVSTTTWAAKAPIEEVPLVLGALAG